MNTNDNQTTCAIETITPDTAKLWLSYNAKNRKLSDPVIDRLVGIIDRGEWMTDCTDGIGLDDSGGVVNGQHRLAAIVRSAQAVDALVVRNVRPEVIKVIDQGRGRTFSQWLQMEGRYENAPILAAAVEALFRLNHGLEVAMPTAQKPTIPQLLDTLSEHHNITHSMAAGAEAYRKVGCPTRPWLVAYHYAMASVDPDLADEFYTGLASGVDLGERSPVHALREKFLRENARDPSRKARNYVLVAWLVKGWEAQRENLEVTERQLNWVTSGRKGEPFPRLTDLPWDISDQAIEPDDSDTESGEAEAGFDFS